MKSKLIFNTICLLLLSSCVNSIEEEPPLDGKGKVTILTSIYRAEEIQTRAALSEAVSRISCWVLQQDGKTAITKEQTSEESAFGKLKLELPYGSYKLVVLGHNGTKSASIADNGDISFSEVRLTDTFLFSTGLTISEGEDATVDATLKRCVACFMLRATDAIPDEVSSVHFSITGAGNVLNAFTGLAPEATDQTRTVTVPESYAGRENIGLSFFTFLPDESTHISVTATARNVIGEELVKRSFTNVPMKVNQRTTYEGKFFRNAQDADITVGVDTEWKEEAVTEF